MATLHSDKEIAQAFRTLGHTDRRIGTGRIAAWAGWATIALFTVAFFSSVVFLLTSEQRAESVRLKQSADLVAQSMESRLLGTTELLMKTSLRLMHIPNVRSQVASAEFSAMNFMQDRREVAEIVIATRDFTVLRSWNNPMSSGAGRRDAGTTLKNPQTRKAITEALERDASVLSIPYVLEPAHQLFADLAVPTALPDQILIARVNLTHLVTRVVELLGYRSYQFDLLLNGNSFFPVDEEGHMGDIQTEVPLSFSHLAGLSLLATSHPAGLLEQSPLPVWLIGGLGCTLLVALLLLVRVQRKEHRFAERLEVEYALRRAISESALTGLRVTDKEGKILYVNETFQKMFGFSREELIGTTPPYPYWAEDITEQFEAMMSHSSGTLHTIDFLAKRKNGETFDGQLSVSQLLDVEGRVLGYIGALYDVTETKRSHERMQAANDRFTRVVQSLASAIAVVSDDDARQIFFMNTPYVRLFGGTADACRRILGVLEAQKKTSIREGLYDEVTDRWFDVRIQTIVWTNDRKAVMLIATDITEWRQMQEQLQAQIKHAEETQRLVTMGEMASSLAHELNQPLAAISNYAAAAKSLLEAHALKPEAATDAFGRIDNQAKRAAAIIKRIRSFAKNKHDTQFAVVPVETIVTEAMELALIQAKKLGASIKVEMAENLPSINGDAVMLEQLLLNLLKNAMEALEPESDRNVELSVSHEAQTDAIVFTIRDHGPGMSDEVKAMLFDAFFTTKKTGMGIGLNICRTIVENHHGRLLVSDTEGGGTTFTVRIPVNTPEESAEKPAEA